MSQLDWTELISTWADPRLDHEDTNRSGRTDLDSDRTSFSSWTYLHLIIKGTDCPGRIQLDRTFPRRQQPISFRLVAARVSPRMAPDAYAATPRAPHVFQHGQDTCRTPPLLPDVKLHDCYSCKAPQHYTHGWPHASLPCTAIPRASVDAKLAEQLTPRSDPMQRATSSFSVHWPDFGHSGFNNLYTITRALCDLVFLLYPRQYPISLPQRPEEGTFNRTLPTVRSGHHATAPVHPRLDHEDTNRLGRTDLDSDIISFSSWTVLRTFQRSIEQKFDWTEPSLGVDSKSETATNQLQVGGSPCAASHGSGRCAATPRAPHVFQHGQDTCRTPPLLPDVRLHDCYSCKAPQHHTHGWPHASVACAETARA
ncbi:hypothetical protein DY000_02062839 [Brassica cretica]|uniref:Uncharacterized protein n=1 Tax=Brassica cretica TaxID=69181 RepID=A0ABQ7AY87_BRACR|nr:hypothetical protein DY000_02062839 [Brassica cretica]